MKKLYRQGRGYIHYNCTIGSFLLHYFLLIYHPYPPSFHEMIFTLVIIMFFPSTCIQYTLQAFTGYCSKEEVSALCPIHNMMWMGTTTGTIKVFHTPTLKAKFTGKLAVGSSNSSCILNILHVPSISCVLVSTANGDIWSFHDGLTSRGLVIQCRITLPDFFQCYHLVAVERELGGSVEVWGTMDNSQLCLLESDREGTDWKLQNIVVDTGDSKLRLCSHIALANFKDKRGRQQCHLWISYRSRGVLVAWDASSRQQIAVINCNQSFPQLKAGKKVTRFPPIESIVPKSIPISQICLK